jgi:hypothetical protein
MRSLVSIIKTSMYKRFILLLLVFISSLVQATAQVDTIYARKKVRTYIKQSIAPVSLIGFGFFMKLNKTSFNDLSIKNDAVSSYPNFYTSADDYLRFASIPFIFGLDFLGVKGKTDYKNRAVIFIKAEAIMLVSTGLLKRSTHEIRPDGSNDQSFPSGHSAQAFLAAAMIQKEFGSKSVWYPIAAYAVATSVGALRILNNKHYASDVLVGAGIGILSVQLAYWTHQYKWNKNIIVMPTYSSNTFGVYFSVKI